MGATHAEAKTNATSGVSVRSALPAAEHHRARSSLGLDPGGGEDEVGVRFHQVLRVGGELVLDAGDESRRAEEVELK